MALPSVFRGSSRPEGCFVRPFEAKTTNSATSRLALRVSEPGTTLQCALPPRWRFLMLRRISFAPKGPRQNSPGQRPGWRLRNVRQSPVRAIHRRSAVAPFQGFFPCFSRCFASPGRCPELFCPAPSGPKPQIAQHQNAQVIVIWRCYGVARNSRTRRFASSRSPASLI
jgi:hypothetical protein